VKLTGARIFLECLKREGVDVLFGLPGGAVLPIYDALYDFAGLRHILVRQEAAPVTPRRDTPARPGRSESPSSRRARRPPTW